ncbi:MAG: DUF5716 family protein [Lachnospiraceae bacterium]|nr:DUF5716 family protein [Lachnospiraceae bacterium]
MNEVRNIQVGFELGRESCSISYFDRQAGEPVSVPTKTGTGLFTFPSVLCKMKTKDVWHFGLEAEFFGNRGDGILIRDIYDRIDGDEAVLIDGKEAAPWQLLAILIRTSLALLGVPNPVHSISGITVTMEELTPNRVQNLKKAMSVLGFRKNRYFLQNSLESYYYFCMSQRQSIWSRNTGLLVFRGDEVTFFIMRENRKIQPAGASITRTAAVTLPEDPAVRDLMLLEYLSSHMEGEVFTGVFITGEGFDQTWAKQTVGFLARNGRRVFYEERLFCKGACYTSLEHTETHSLKGHVYLGADTVRTGIDMNVIHFGTRADVSLIEAGRSWYENESECELILDNKNSIDVTLVSMNGRVRVEESMPLEGLPERPNLATRLHLSAVCRSADTCELTAEDLGFGEFFPATHKKWTKMISLEELI